MNISFPYTKFPHEHVLNRGGLFRERLCRLRSCLARGDSIDAGGLDLLNRAVGLANDHKCYAIQLEETLLSGCTVELRELLCPFGDYFGAPRSLHSDRGTRQVHGGHDRFGARETWAHGGDQRFQEPSHEHPLGHGA